MSEFRLVPFSEENTAIVLSWRNSDRVRKNMLDDSIISEESHRAFIKNLIQDSSKKYYLVEINGMPVACIYFNGLDSKEVVWGCYIGASKPVPGLFVALFIISLRYVFLTNKADKLLSEVADYNLSPINLNRFAGVLKTGGSIKKTNSGRDVFYISYEVDKSSYNAVLNKCIGIVPSSIRNALENLKVELK